MGRICRRPFNVISNVNRWLERQQLPAIQPKEPKATQDTPPTNWRELTPEERWRKDRL